MIRVRRPAALYVIGMLALVLIAIVATGAAAGAADAPDEPRNQVAIYDDQLVAIAKDAPGFGGIYVDAETRQLVIWLKDLSKRATAEARIAEEFGPGRISASGTAVRLAEYGFDELKGWHRALNDVV